MADFKVGCSPITSKIYAWKVLKNGIWGVKHDVTHTAVSAVAEHLLQLEQKVRFDYDGKPYELKVVEVPNFEDCVFEADTESSSATICKWCKNEKHLHK